MRSTCLMVSAGLLSLAGCVVGDFDPIDRPCPCAEGFVCDTTLNRCVRGFSMPEDSGTSPDPDLDAGMSGTPDQGFVDAGQVAPAPTSSICDSPEAADWLFCDGFESENLDVWNIRADTGLAGQAIVERQTERVYRGRGALRTRVSGGARSASVFAGTFETPANEIWLRGYFYIVDDVSNVEFFAISDPVYRQSVVAAIRQTTPDLHTHFREDGDIFGFSTALFSPNRWLCVQMHMRLDARGRTALYINGVRVDDLEVDADIATDIPAFRINAGFVDWRDGRLDETREIYVDDVVVSTSTVSCD